MSVISIEEAPESPKGRAMADGSRAYTRIFYVTTDDDDDGPRVVLANGNLPQPGDMYIGGNDVDTSAFAKEADCQRHPEVKRRWTATYMYDTKFEESQNQPNPLDRPPEVNFSFQSFEEPLDKDKNNKAMVNAAGKPFEGVTKTRSIPVLQITRNEVGFSMPSDIDYIDKLNSDTFFGFAPGKCKMQNISARRRFENEIQYYERTYEVTIAPTSDDWQKVLLNAGYMKRTAAGSTVLEHIIMGDKTAASEPQLLSTGGETVVVSTDANYKIFDIYDEKAFAPLNLPTGI